ncbi:hypothetical protein ACHAWF_001118 [Thalassiosira exigua]
MQRWHRPLHLALLLVGARRRTLVASQAPKQQPPLQPLGDVLHLVLDKDKDQRATMEEVESQTKMLEGLLQGAEGPEAEEYRAMLKGFANKAPLVFELLDVDGDGALTQSELKYATKFEKSLKKGGGMRDLLRDVFGMLDADGDDRLSADELLAGSKDEELISRATGRFHELFPLRESSGDLEPFVRGVLAAASGGGTDLEGVERGMKWMDDDGDGHIQRKEVGRHYNEAGKKFLEVSKTIKQMGPMLALFGGGDMGGMGGGGGGGGFKMDL